MWRNSWEDDEFVKILISCVFKIQGVKCQKSENKYLSNPEKKMVLYQHLVSNVTTHYLQ